VTDEKEMSMEYVRRIDRAAIAAAGPDERLVQRLLDRSTGAVSCSVSWIRTPAGGGSPEGLHVHDVDQIFYVLDGVMHIEIGGEVSVLESGALVVFPALQPHRNWNEGPDPTVHLAVNAPAPDPDVPFARPVS
jgi:mannose-6-phosphate isomerase-like protein (cupin superfamily)